MDIKTIILVILAVIAAVVALAVFSLWWMKKAMALLNEWVFGKHKNQSNDKGTLNDNLFTLAVLVPFFALALKTSSNFAPPSVPDSFVTSTATSKETSCVIFPSQSHMVSKDCATATDEYFGLTFPLREQDAICTPSTMSASA